MNTIINIVIRVITIISSAYNFVKYNLDKDNFKNTYKDVKNFILLSIKYSDFLRTNKEDVVTTFLMFPVIFLDTKDIIYVITYKKVVLINKYELKNNTLKDVILDSDIMEEDNKVKDIIRESDITYNLIFQDDKSYKINLIGYTNEL